MSALHTGHLHPPGNIPGGHLCLDAKSTLVQPDSLCQLKIPMTQTEIEPATFWPIVNALTDVICHCQRE
jgi:hypothetical protein